MRKFVALLMILCAMSISQAIILDFEAAEDLNDWTVNNGTIEQSTTVATSGTYSMKYTLTSNNYWGLRWDAPAGEIPTEFGIVKVDITRYAADWNSGQWANIGQSLALLSDGPSGWVEHNPIAVIDRTTGEILYEGAPLATATDWGGWLDDTEWTIVYDCSDYDGTGATWFAFQLATNCDPISSGISYIDFFQLPVASPRNPNPADGGYGGLHTNLSWTNATDSLNSVTAWFGIWPDPNENDPNTLLSEENIEKWLAPVYTESSPSATSTCPNANIGTLTESQEYTWCVTSEPNNFPIPLWTFTATVNETPIADAGEDQDLWGEPNVVATLDGSGSSDDGLINPTLTYTWVQTAGPDAEIVDNSAATTTVILPVLANTVEYWNDPAADAYVFELTVDDGQIQAMDSVTITLSSDSCVASVEAGGYYFYGDIASPDGVGYEFRDCKIDLYDFAELALNWLGCSNTIEGCD